MTDNPKQPNRLSYLVPWAIMAGVMGALWLAVELIEVLVAA